MCGYLLSLGEQPEFMLSSLGLCPHLMSFFKEEGELERVGEAPHRTCKIWSFDRCQEASKSAPVLSLWLAETKIELPKAGNGCGGHSEPHWQRFVFFLLFNLVCFGARFLGELKKLSRFGVFCLLCARICS